MCNTEEKRYYTPRFSKLASVSVRRFAWALGIHMTEAAELMVRLIPSIIDPAKVCLSCQDNSECHSCCFRTQLTPQEQGALLAAL